jgi:hypothetical protein
MRNSLFEFKIATHEINFVTKKNEIISSSLRWNDKKISDFSITLHFSMLDE